VQGRRRRVRGTDGNRGAHKGRSGRGAGEQIRRVEAAWHVGGRECIGTAWTREEGAQGSRREAGVPIGGESLFVIAMA